MAEAVTGTTVLVALGAAGATFALLLAGLFLRRRGRPGQEAAAPAEETALGFDSSKRLERKLSELSEALARAEEENRRHRALGELARSIDLDEVLEHTLEAAGALPGVDAAVVSIQDEANGPKPIVAAVGMSAEDAEQQVVSGPPEGRQGRAVSIVHRYPPETEANDLIHSGVVVPVPRNGGAIGFLAVYTRSAGHRFEEEAIRELEELAQRAGPAIENARSFREARQLADLDALTGLHNRRYFHETLAREVARAQRYKRRLALVVFDLDNFKAVNDRIGHLGGDAVLAEVADRIREVVRSADIACRVGGDEFAVILPESSTGDADQLYHRLRGAVSSRVVGQAGRLLLSAGIADLDAEDDPKSFFERADGALYRAKERGKGQVVEANADGEAATEAS
jgi:diguanylate cyclase (GGDEF)-like protein